MYERWKKYGADSFRFGLINFLTTQDANTSWELSYEAGFFGRWDSIRNGNFRDFKEFPRLSADGRVTFFRYSANDIVILQSRFSFGERSPYADLIPSICRELTPNDFRWPRPDSFDYGRVDWRNWLKFQKLLSFEAHGRDLDPEINPAEWPDILGHWFARLIPLDDRQAILDAYRDHGFQPQ